MDIRKRIASEIILKKNGIRLDRFLNKVLYGQKGYYLKKKPIGKKYDFVTAPEISQMFGEIIGVYLFYIWNTKINKKFNLIELGPGNATLFKDIAKSVQKFTSFFDNAEIFLIEINRELEKIQKENLRNHKLNLKWRKKINFKSNIPSIIYSNEFFDCFPVRQFIYKNEWYEKYVFFNQIEKNFILEDKLVKNKKLTSYLNNYKEYKLLEVSFKRNEYFDKLCKFIKKNGGLILTVDYGYSKENQNFTLQAIQNHKFSHVLENIGEKDISSHVNFNDFVKIAKKNNLKIEEFCTQGDFLIKYGILERKKTLLNFSDPKKIENDANRLIDEKQMGKLFKILIVSNLK